LAISPKAAGVLKLNSYWFKIFRKASSAAIKPMGLTIFQRLLHEVFAAFGKLIIWVLILAAIGNS
jgi:hypothetical protein